MSKKSEALAKLNEFNARFLSYLQSVEWTESEKREYVTRVIRSLYVMDVPKSLVDEVWEQEIGGDEKTF